MFKILRPGKASAIFLIVMATFSITSYSQSTQFSPGSFIVNMGVTPQTAANALFPYGMVYDLVKNYDVPVYWIINGNKIKDGIDFVYNGTAYRGGPFVIAQENRTAAVDARISYWQSNGVVGIFAPTVFTAPVAQKISAVPRWTLDSKTGQIAQGYISNAGIPLETTDWTEPRFLNSCNDIFVLPHADPAWSSHGKLIDWNLTYKGSIWAGCHAVSVLENMVNPGNPSQQGNFLALNSAGVGSQALVPFGSHKDGSVPFNNNSYAGDQVMQFLGSIDNATTNGSEQIYLPALGGGWRPSTKVAVFDPSHVNVPANSPGKAAVLAYGRGFGDNNRGLVMYEGGHSLNKGTNDGIAAQRAFLNFSFMATLEKSMTLNVSGIQAVMVSNHTYALSLAISQAIPAGPYSIQWTSSCGGSFTNATGLATNFTPPLVGAIQSCEVKVKVTDACGRSRFYTQIITLTSGPRPPEVNSDSLSFTPDCINRNPTITIDALSNDSEPDGQPMTISSVTGSNGAWSVNPNQTIRFVPATGFYGSTTATYTVCDNTSPVPLCVSNTIKITIGSTGQQPVANDDIYTILEDSIQQLQVLSNDLPGGGGGALKISGIAVQPLFGKVSVNPNNTITYLPNPDNKQNDSFYYKVSNGANYISIAKVKILVSADGCSPGYYQTCIPGPNPISITAVEDASVNSKFPNNNFGADNFIVVDRENTDKYRSLVRFNLPVLTCDPAISPVITSATLKLYKSGGGGGSLSVNVHRTLAGWNQSQVTWNNRLTATTWSAGGGDFDPTIIASASVNADGLYTWDVSSLVSNWYGNPASYPNFGLLLKTIEGGGNRDPNFVSSENTSGLMKPTLEISYTIPMLCKIIPVRSPLAMPDTATTDALTPIVIPVQINDYFPTAGTNSLSVITSSVSSGSAVVSGNNILYTPQSNFSGTATLQYRVTNATTGLSDTAVISVFIDYVAPIANNDSISIYSGASGTKNVTLNDVDLQGIGVAAAIIGEPKFGTYNASGNSITYNAPSNFIGRDTIVYKLTNVVPNLCNSTLAADTAYFIIIVNNRNPVAIGDTVTTNPCQAITIDVLKGDSDPENGSLSVNSIGPLIPVNSGSLSTDGNLVYFTPNPSYTGSSATFTYTIVDDAIPQGVSAPATTIINFSSSVNLPPLPVTDIASGVADQPTFIDVLSNDSDPEGDLLTVSFTGILRAPSHGTVTAYSNNLVRYDPAPGFTGIDSFQYRLSDLHFGIAGGICTNVSQSRVASVIVHTSNVFVILNQKQLLLSGVKERLGNRLFWTVNEKMPATITVEKNSNNLSFSPVSTIYHTNLSDSKYQWRDNEKSATDAFYRLKLTTINNEILYSNILLLKGSRSEKDVMVYPSPFARKLTVEIWAETTETISLALFDLLGHKVVEKKYNPKLGFNQISLTSVEHLLAGQYLLSVRQNLLLLSKMVIKTK